MENFFVFVCGKRYEQWLKEEEKKRKNQKVNLN